MGRLQKFYSMVHYEPANGKDTLLSCSWTFLIKLCQRDKMAMYVLLSVYLWIDQNRRHGMYPQRVQLFTMHQMNPSARSTE